MNIKTGVRRLLRRGHGEGRREHYDGIACIPIGGRAGSAEREIAGDGQDEDASLVDDKRKPDVVIKTLHG